MPAELPEKCMMQYVLPAAALLKCRSSRGMIARYIAASALQKWRKKKTAELQSNNSLVRVSKKIATLSYGNAVRSKITDFRTALPTLVVPKENIARRANFLWPRRHNALLLSAAGGSRLLCSVVTHPGALLKPIIQRFFAYKVFFRRTGMGKRKMRSYRCKNKFWGSSTDWWRIAFRRFVFLYLQRLQSMMTFNLK